MPPVEVMFITALLLGGLPAFLVWTWWRRRRIARTWARVRGEVVEKVDANTEGVGLYPRVAYEFEGRKYRSLAMDWYSLGLIAPVGTKVDLLVDPLNPGTCVIYSEERLRKDRLIR